MSKADPLNASPSLRQATCLFREPIFSTWVWRRGEAVEECCLLRSREVMSPGAAVSLRGQALCPEGGGEGLPPDLGFRQLSGTELARRIWGPGFPRLVGLLAPPRAGSGSAGQPGTERPRIYPHLGRCGPAPPPKTLTRCILGKYFPDHPGAQGAPGCRSSITPTLLIASLCTKRLTLTCLS